MVQRAIMEESFDIIASKAVIVILCEVANSRGGLLIATEI